MKSCGTCFNCINGKPEWCSNKNAAGQEVSARKDLSVSVESPIPEPAAPTTPTPIFSCPRCGAHDYALFAVSTGGGCVHCMKRELAAAREELKSSEEFVQELSRLLHKAELLAVERGAQLYELRDLARTYYERPGHIESEALRAYLERGE